MSFFSQSLPFPQSLFFVTCSLTLCIFCHPSFYPVLAGSVDPSSSLPSPSFLIHCLSVEATVSEYFSWWQHAFPSCSAPTPFSSCCFPEWAHDHWNNPMTSLLAQLCPSLPQSRKMRMMATVLMMMGCGMQQSLLPLLLYSQATRNILSSADSYACAHT